MNVSDRLQLMLGSTEVPVFPFPSPATDLDFTNPLVSPDGQSLLVTGYGPGVLNRAFVGRFDSIWDMAQIVRIPDCVTIHPQVRPRTDEVAVIAGCANVYDSGLWIVPADGGAPRHVLKGLVAAPTWSPDGEWILFGFQEDRTSSPSLWIASADGSTASLMAAGWASWPAWIPADTTCGLCPT